MNLAEAFSTENSHGKTWNGADALTTTGSANLDFFGRIGSMRTADKSEKLDLFDAAYKENPMAAMRLLFYTRDIRGGYGERDAFNEIFSHLAETHTKTAEANIPLISEYGRDKDLYSLIGTRAERYMWAYMREQFQKDVKNLEEGKPVSLLAKWIASPNASSKTTALLGKKTAYMLGYDKKHMKQYRHLLVALRKAIDIPEAKMATNKWEDIDYSAVPSKAMVQYRNAFKKHDAGRFNSYIDSVNKGETKMNMNTTNPCDIMQKVANGDNSVEVNTMWKQLPNITEHNALVICDTSGSMTWNYGSPIMPLTVAASLAIYFAQRNKGEYKDKFITFSDSPEFIELKGETLGQMWAQINRAPWGGSTNLEAAFNLILNTAIKYHISAEDMPETLLVISDMQINPYNTHIGEDGFMTFTDVMKRKYEQAGYKLPHVTYWNVNAMNATFHAGMSDNAVSLVSGYSPNVMKQVMDNIGKTPLDLMNEVITSERYSPVAVVD